MWEFHKTLDKTSFFSYIMRWNYVQVKQEYPREAGVFVIFAPRALDVILDCFLAGVVELVDAGDLKSPG